MVNARRKGATGEREFCKWLQQVLQLDYLPQRNLEQVREGGADIVDVLPFSFEVKKVEILSLRNWWIQAVEAITTNNPVAVVAYRQKRRQWKFLISAQLIGLSTGFMQLEEHEAKQWLQLRYAAHKKLNEFLHREH